MRYVQGLQFTSLFFDALNDMCINIFFVIVDLNQFVISHAPLIFPDNFLLQYNAEIYHFEDSTQAVVELYIDVHIKGINLDTSNINSSFANCVTPGANEFLARVK